MEFGNIRLERITNDGMGDCLYLSIAQCVRAAVGKLTAKEVEKQNVEEDAMKYRITASFLWLEAIDDEKKRFDTLQDLPIAAILLEDPEAGDKVLEAYVYRLRNKGEWGGVPQIMALSYILNYKINVLSIDKQTGLLMDMPVGEVKPISGHWNEEELFLLYYSPVHYEALIPERAVRGGVSHHAETTLVKKSWRLFLKKREKTHPNWTEDFNKAVKEYIEGGEKNPYDKALLKAAKEIADKKLGKRMEAVREADEAANEAWAKYAQHAFEENGQDFLEALQAATKQFPRTEFGPTEDEVKEQLCPKCSASLLLMTRGTKGS